MSRYRDVVRADIRRCVGEHEASTRRVLATVWEQMGLQAVLVYRLGRWLKDVGWQPLLWPLLPAGWLLYALGLVIVRYGYGIRLALSADIGPGFWVGHFGGIEVVNCRLGEHCSVGQHTRVGSTEDAEGPEVGDGVWIGAHARITGHIRIGSGSTVAPGARVTRDLPERALVVGDPGRVVFRGYDNRQILPRA